MKRLAMIALLALGACGEWPDAGEPTAAGASGDWPELLPLDQVLAGGTIAAAEDAEASALSRRAVALRARARVMRSDTSDIDALRARLAR